MLSDHPVDAAIPTDDIERLRPFYEDVLGFRSRESNPAGVYHDAGAATIPIGRTAWFRDPDGNLIGLIQFND